MLIKNLSYKPVVSVMYTPMVWVLLYNFMDAIYQIYLIPTVSGFHTIPRQ